MDISWVQNYLTTDADTAHWSVKVYPVPVHSTRRATRIGQKSHHPACWCWYRFCPRCCHHPQLSTNRARLDLKNWRARLTCSSSTSSTSAPKDLECTALVEFAAASTKQPVEVSVGRSRSKVSCQDRRRHDLWEWLHQGLPTAWFWVSTSRATQTPMCSKEEAPWHACVAEALRFPDSKLKRLQVDSRHGIVGEHGTPPCIAGVDWWKIKLVFKLPFHDESDWPSAKFCFHHCPKASHKGKLLLQQGHLESPSFSPRILILAPEALNVAPLEALVIWPIEVDGVHQGVAGWIKRFVTW